MPVIMSKTLLAPNVYHLEVDAPLIAERRKPGQFVMVRANEQGERIPLTIVDSDPVAGTVTLVVQTLGEGTRMLCQIERGEPILDIAGPLGMPTDVSYIGETACVGGGIGVAPLYPIAKGLARNSNKVTSFIGARTQELIILEDQMRAVSDELVVATDDGSYGFDGFVPQALGERLAAGYKPDLVVAIGPLPMMRAAAEVTRPYGIKTIVSLNPIMVDGTGMCGGCRVTVGGERMFACVDGPEFDGHLVDYDELASRQRTYHDQESCRIGPNATA
jgi:ferredoxin/flavodoxin---NADP+ reductase